jgi:hypothetical protein
VFLGICVVSISSMVLRVDDPETAYNESEAPVNFAIPFSNNTVADTHLIIRVSRPITIVRGEQAGDNAAIMYESMAKPGKSDSHSRLKFLRALLC